LLSGLDQAAEGAVRGEQVVEVWEAVVAADVVEQDGVQVAGLGLDDLQEQLPLPGDPASGGAEEPFGAGGWRSSHSIPLLQVIFSCNYSTGGAVCQGILLQVNQKDTKDTKIFILVSLVPWWFSGLMMLDFLAGLCYNPPR
jgi:hypothetical protein